MINFNVRLYNPFSNRFDSGRFWHGVVGSTRKAWEIQIMKTNTVFEIDFQLTVRQDHAGIKLELGLVGYNICAQIYDTRHWNDEENRWHVYD